MDKLSFAEGLGEKISKSRQDSFEAGNELDVILHSPDIPSGDFLETRQG